MSPIRPFGVTGAERSADLALFRGVRYGERETARSLHAEPHDHARRANGRCQQGYLRPMRPRHTPCPPTRRAELPTVAPLGVWRARVPSRAARALQSGWARAPNSRGTPAIRDSHAAAHPGAYG